MSWNKLLLSRGCQRCTPSLGELCDSLGFIMNGLQAQRLSQAYPVGITPSWFGGPMGAPSSTCPQTKDPISFCTEARWPGDVITVPAHLICMQPVSKLCRFHKDTLAEMERFITFFSPGALNWVTLLPSKFYLPGNMQMLVGQLRKREEFQKIGNRPHRCILPFDLEGRSPDCMPHLVPGRSFAKSYKISCVSC